MKAVVAIALLVLLSACAPKKGSEPDPRLTIFSDFGMYLYTPLDFRGMRLNEPNVMRWQLSDEGGVYADCELTVLFEGSRTSGRLITSNPRTTMHRENAGTSYCMDVSDLNYEYLVTERGLVIQNFLFPRVQ